MVFLVQGFAILWRPRPCFAASHWILLAFRFQISDSGFQIADFRFQISDFIFQFSDFRFQISYFRFQFSDSRFHISDSRFRISDCRFQITDFRFKISHFRLQIPGQGELGSRGWGNLLAGAGGTRPGHRQSLPFKKLYKNPLGKPS